MSGTKRFGCAYNAVNDITAVQRDNGDGFTYDLNQQIIDYRQNGAVNLGAEGKKGVGPFFLHFKQTLGADHQPNTRNGAKKCSHLEKLF